MKTENLTREALTRYAAESRESFEALLKDFVEIPSVSVDPTKKNAIRENAKLAAETIRRFGGETKRAIGHPQAKPRLHREEQRTALRGPEVFFETRQMSASAPLGAKTPSPI